MTPAPSAISSGALPALPSALAVIPCLNEAAHIEGIVRQLLENAQYIDLRIVIADGGSTDGTGEIAQMLATGNSRILFLNNEKKIQSAALNLAVQRCGGDAEFLIRVDAHAHYPARYCESLIEEQMRTGADSVVVSMVAVGQSCFQLAAAAAQNSRLGNGGSAHRRPGEGRFVDHGHHALMRMAAFRCAGGYDETFSHNEDAELDTRLRAAGFRIWLTGTPPISYFPRRTAKTLFSQYLNYGKGRARTLLKHRKWPRLRQILPLAVAPALLLALLSPLQPIFAAPALGWAGLCLFYGFFLGLRERNACAAMSGVAVMIMHCGWSAGFLTQAVKIVGATLVSGRVRQGTQVSLRYPKPGAHPVKAPNRNER